MVLGGGAVSCERGTPAEAYLAHKEAQPARTPVLQGPRGLCYLQHEGPRGLNLEGRSSVAGLGTREEVVGSALHVPVRRRQRFVHLIQDYRGYSKVRAHTAPRGVLCS